MCDQLNNYHPSIKLTIEVNPSKFLDTKITNINGTYKLNAYRKKHNYLHHGPPKRYKQNKVKGDLHCLKTISSNFDKEIPLIKEVYEA